MVKLWKYIIEWIEVLDKAYQVADKKREHTFVEMLKETAAKINREVI